MTGWQDREPDLPSGGHHVIERRLASRRVYQLNRELCTALVTKRIGSTDEQRENAGRRADDLQDEVLAIRAQFPDLSLGECQ